MCSWPSMTSGADRSSWLSTPCRRRRGRRKIGEGGEAAHTTRSGAFSTWTSIRIWPLRSPWPIVTGSTWRSRIPAWNCGFSSISKIAIPISTARMLSAGLRDISARVRRWPIQPWSRSTNVMTTRWPAPCGWTPSTGVTDLLRAPIRAPESGVSSIVSVAPRANLMDPSDSLYLFLEHQPTTVSMDRDHRRDPGQRSAHPDHHQETRREQLEVNRSGSRNTSRPRRAPAGRPRRAWVAVGECRPRTGARPVSPARARSASRTDPDRPGRSGLG
ncbi:MAG: hypothetical protein QOE51_4524 [Actinoplanes sp.]|nr:hypothetical protein [Actinoplanes sp.]